MNDDPSDDSTTGPTTAAHPRYRCTTCGNLTRFDVQKIEEIDSGSPANDMHDLKIKDSLAKGRPLVVYFSYDRGGRDPLPWLTDIRWARLGSLVR